VDYGSWPEQQRQNAENLNWIKGVISTKQHDLVMWSKGKEKILPRVFSAAKRELNERINQKIFVVGDKSDLGVPVAEAFGWDAYSTNKWSIPVQANEALRHVETEQFISLENDLVLARGWYDKISKHLENPDVAVAQGVRLYTNPRLRNYVKYAMENKGMMARWGVSIDNNIFNTEIVRSLGGFPEDCLFCSDSHLRETILANGYQWIIDDSIISDHVWDNFFTLIHHRRDSAAKCRHRSNDEVEKFWIRYGTAALNLPFKSIDMALKTNDPFLIYAMPIRCISQIPAHLTQRLRWGKEGMRRISLQKPNSEFDRKIASELLRK
jgi:hypothetical protein